MHRLLDGGVEADAVVSGRGVDLTIVQRMALSEVATADQLDAVRLLLDHGADPSLANDVGCTPLMVAALGGHAWVVRDMVARGVALDAVASPQASMFYY
jgi:hypothetical protein